MYTMQTSNLEPNHPSSTQHPLRPASRVSPFRINVLKSLRLHRVSSLLVALLTLGLGLAVIAKHKPTYVATSTIYVSPTPIKTLVDDRELDRPYDSFVQETIRDISRYEVVAETIHRLPPGTLGYPGEPERATVQRLQSALDISRAGQTYQVEISIEGTRPEHLADIVNTLTAVYLEKAKSDEFYASDQRLDLLKQEQARIRNERDSLLQEQDQISRALGVAVIGAKGPSPVDQNNVSIEAQLIVAREQRIQAQSHLDALNNGDASASNSALNTAADELIANDPQLLALKTQLSQHRADLSDKLNGMTENNPARKQNEAQLAQIDKNLQEMQNDLRKRAAAHLEEQLRTQLNQAQLVESRLNAEFLRGTRQATDTAPKIQRAEEIAARLESLQSRYGAVEERISNLELESSSPGSVHLFTPAMPPLGPEKSRIRNVLIGIFPISIFFGIITAVALDLLDPKIYTASDVEAVLGFAPIGMLFDDREVTQTVFDEYALRLAAGVDHAARRSGARTFVLTGVNSGAGTTAIVESLGSMLAKLGRKTLAIDPSGKLDPLAFVTMGTDLLKRPVHLPDRGIDDPNLATELQRVKLGPEPVQARVSTMGGFVLESFQSISSEYDIVLIDAAPILLSAETEYLARMADVTVLVAEAGKTKKAWLNRAARLLERLGVAGAAAVVNKVHPSRAEEPLKHDLREFDLRTDRVNLQEWWKPVKKTARVSAASTIPFGQDKAQANEENVAYARDI